MTYPFYGGVPPHESVDTSLDAALRIIPYAATQRAMVLRYIRSCASNGATQDEIEVALGIRHSSTGARCCELVKDDAIVQTLNRRRTRSGRWARVYVVAALAQPPHPPPPPAPPIPTPGQPRPRPAPPTPAPRPRARRVPEAQMGLFDPF